MRQWQLWEIWLKYTSLRLAKIHILLNFIKHLSKLKAETEEGQDDEVFENIGEMEMDLCAIINKTFRLSDDYWFDPDEWKKCKKNPNYSEANEICWFVMKK